MSCKSSWAELEISSYKDFIFRSQNLTHKQKYDFMILEKRPTKALINLHNLVANAREIETCLPHGQEVLPIIKANAYGHGAVPVAQTLVDAGFNKLAVATFEEGVELRQGAIATDVYVLNGLHAALCDYHQHRLIPILHQMDEIHQAVHFSKSLKQALPIGVKFDTGMGRLGLLPNEASEAIEILKSANVDLRCVITHLARADEALEYTQAPYERFHEIRKNFRSAGFATTKFSICNSASIIDKHFDDFDWVRPGIALYGVYPHERQRELMTLKPVLELKTRIIELKKLPAGASVGYGATFVTKRDSIIALLPIGYADGYPRLISNRGFVLVRGERAPIVGRISMDLMAVDVTSVADVCLYDEVTLIGYDGAQNIRVEEVASWAETISYEILTAMMPRVHREYV